MELASSQITKCYDILVIVGGIYSSDGWLSQIEIESPSGIQKPFVQDLRSYIANLYFTKYLEDIQVNQANQSLDYVNLYLLCKFFSIINMEIPDFIAPKIRPKSFSFYATEDKADENYFIHRIVAKMKRRNEILADILIAKEREALDSACHKVLWPNNILKNTRNLIQEKELRIENMVQPFRFYFGELLHLSSENADMSEKIIRPSINLQCVSENCLNLVEIMNTQIPEFRSECVECKFKENILAYAYCMEHREKVRHFRKCEVHENEKVMREERAENIRREGPYQSAFDIVFERRRIQREEKKL